MNNRAVKRKTHAFSPQDEDHRAQELGKVDAHPRASREPGVGIVLVVLVDLLIVVGVADLDERLGVGRDVVRRGLRVGGDDAGVAWADDGSGGRVEVLDTRAGGCASVEGRGRLGRGDGRAGGVDVLEGAAADSRPERLIGSAVEDASGLRSARAQSGTVDLGA